MLLNRLFQHLIQNGCLRRELFLYTADGALGCFNFHLKRVDAAQQLSQIFNRFGGARFGCSKRRFFAAYIQLGELNGSFSRFDLRLQRIRKPFIFERFGEAQLLIQGIIKIE